MRMPFVLGTGYVRLRINTGPTSLVNRNPPEGTLWHVVPESRITDEWRYGGYP